MLSCWIMIKVHLTKKNKFYNLSIFLKKFGYLVVIQKKGVVLPNYAQSVTSFTVELPISNIWLPWLWYSEQHMTSYVKFFSLIKK